MSKTTRQRLGVDFDGVIHQYDGWGDGSICGDPIGGALETIQKLATKFDVFIFTTRAREELNYVHLEADRQIPKIRFWLINHASLRGLDVDFFENIVITDRKMPAIAYIDDRGIRFTNWSDIKKYFL